MRTKISRRLLLPLLYGVLLAWLVVGAGAVVVLRLVSSASLPMAIIAASAALLLALFPAMRRAAVVYSQALRYHRAEYLYDLGNGVEAALAVSIYEKKVRRAIVAWLRLRLARSSFSVLPITFCALLMSGVGLLAALEITVLLGIMVIVAVVIALVTMLRAARRYCYDRFGNIRA